MAYKLLSSEQRKGLLYGSLISAGLAAAMSARYGGDIRDALGAGAFGMTTGYSGGLDELVKMRHADIETQKQEELIRASQEATKLGSERFEHEKQRSEEMLGLQKATLGIHQKKQGQEESDIKRYMDWMNRQKGLYQPVSGYDIPPLGEMEQPALPKDIFAAIQGLPMDQGGHAIQNYLASQTKTRTPAMVQYPTKPGEPVQYGFVNPEAGQMLPPGAQPPSQAGVYPWDLGAVLQGMTRSGQPMGPAMPKSVPPGTAAGISAANKRAEEKPAPKPNPETIYRKNPKTGRYETDVVDVNTFNFKDPNNPGWKLLKDAHSIEKILIGASSAQGNAPATAAKETSEFRVISVKKK